MLEPSFDKLELRLVCHFITSARELWFLLPCWKDFGVSIILCKVSYECFNIICNISFWRSWISLHLLFRHCVSSIHNDEIMYVLLCIPSSIKCCIFQPAFGCCALKRWSKATFLAKIWDCVYT